MTIAALASALASFACAAAPTLDALVVARMLAGAAAGALIPLSIAWIGDVVSYDRRQTVLARFLVGQMLFATCLFIGQSTGVALAGYAADRFGTAPTILVEGGLVLALGLLFGAVLRGRGALTAP